MQSASKDSNARTTSGVTSAHPAHNTADGNSSAKPARPVVKCRERVLPWPFDQLNGKRLIMWNARGASLALKDGWSTQADSVQRHHLQGLPPELRTHVVSLGLKGESLHRRLQLIKTLERVNKSWAALIAETKPGFEQAGALANHERLAMTAWMEGAFNVPLTVQGDRFYLSTDWDLFCKTEADLQTFCELQDGKNRRTLGPDGTLVGNANEHASPLGSFRPTLDVHEALLHVPAPGTPLHDAWRAFLAAHCLQIRRLAVRVDCFTSSINSLLACTNLRELQLTDELDSSLPQAIDLKPLCGLKQLKALTVLNDLLERVPDEVLEKLESLSLCGIGLPNIQADKLKRLKKLRLLPLVTTEHGAVLTKLPSGLSLLEVSASTRSPAVDPAVALRSFRCGFMSTLAPVLARPHLSSLELDQCMSPENLDDICAWIRGPDSRAGVFVLGESQVSGWLQSLTSALSENNSLRKLSLPPVCWQSEDISALTAWAGQRPDLAELDLSFDGAVDLGELERLLLAVARAKDCRFTLHFSTSGDDNSALDNALRNFMRRHRELDWSYQIGSQDAVRQSSLGYVRN